MSNLNYNDDIFYHTDGIVKTLKIAQRALKSSLEDAGMKGVKYTARTYSFLNAAYHNVCLSLEKFDPERIKLISID